MGGEVVGEHPQRTSCVRPPAAARRVRCAPRLLISATTHVRPQAQPAAAPWIMCLHSAETGMPGGYVICPSIIFLGSLGSAGLKG